MSAESNSKNPIKKASIYALFSELRKRQGIECLVIEDEYILKIKKKEVDIL